MPLGLAADQAAQLPSAVPQSCFVWAVVCAGNEFIFGDYNSPTSDLQGTLENASAVVGIFEDSSSEGAMKQFLGHVGSRMGLVGKALQAADMKGIYNACYAICDSTSRSGTWYLR